MKIRNYDKYVGYEYTIEAETELALLMDRIITTALKKELLFCSVCGTHEGGLRRYGGDMKIICIDCIKDEISNE